MSTRYTFRCVDGGYELNKDYQTWEVYRRLGLLEDALEEAEALVQRKQETPERLLTCGECCAGIYKGDLVFTPSDTLICEDCFKDSLLDMSPTYMASHLGIAFSRVGEREPGHD